MDKTRLLLVEDDPSLAGLLLEYLTDSDYEVLHCDNGEDAMDLLDKEKFDVVLTDIVLPKASGLCVLDKIGGNPKETIVTLMTGYSGLEDAMHAVSQGAYDFVSKPFQFPEIRVRLDNAVKYQSLLRANGQAAA